MNQNSDIYSMNLVKIYIWLSLQQKQSILHLQFQMEFNLSAIH